jgi:bacillithiol system protein YtxJ
MKWQALTTEYQVRRILEESKTTPVMIFKHSNRCSTSRLVLDRLTRKWKEDEMGHLRPYFLDLISFRDISNFIAREFNVPHESPQVLIIENGRSIFDCSHFDINYDQILAVSRN